MPKVTDHAQYFAEIAQRAGLDADRIQQALAVLGDPEVGKVLATGYKALPDYSHDLDAVRDRTKAETEKAWYDTNKELIERANKVLEAANGTPAPTERPTESATYTKEQLEALIQQEAIKRASNVGANLLDIVRIREDHLRTFGTPLDDAAWEKAVRDNGWENLGVKQSYKEFIAPQIEARQKAEFEKRLQEAREEGIREGVSKARMPLDSGPRQFSALFDPNSDLAKMSPAEREKRASDLAMQTFMEKMKTA